MNKILAPYLEDAILAGYRGSIVHGTYRPNSEPNSIDDKDVMIIVVPSLDHYFGLKEFGSKGTKEAKRDEWDIVTYEVCKFIRLLSKGNPNVLSLLWITPKHYLKITSAGQLILDNRKLFATKHVYHAFTGYAYSQLYKMEHMAFYRIHSFIVNYNSGGNDTWCRKY